jgi:hypothetical protein
MQCVDARDSYIDSLLRNVKADDNVLRHAETCSDCAAEFTALREQWEMLGRLAHYDRTQVQASASVRMQVAPPSMRRRSWMQTAAVLIVLVTSGALGYRMGAANRPDTANRDGSQYMLLFYQTPASDSANARLSRAEVVGRFRNWASLPAVRANIIAGEELSSDGAVWLNGAQPTSQRLQPMATGYFVISATDDQEALTIARSSPHAQAGGITEVRHINRGARR